MAARRDEWIEIARKQRAADLPELFKTLTTLSRPATERRLSALASWPKQATLAKHAAELLRAFPFDIWELGAATRALGLAIIQGAEAEAFEATKLPQESEGVTEWRVPALEAGKRFVARSRGLPAAQPFKDVTLPLKPRQALQKAWLELAASRNPDALPQLLERLGDGPSTDLCTRALELLEFPRDARIADAVQELLLYPKVTPKAENPVFLLQGLLLCAHGDKSHGAAVKALAEKIPSLDWLPAPTDTAKKTKQKAPSRKVDEKSFLQSIAEDPTDLSRRVVFADWLTERGDPRGEFITLQLAAAQAPLEPKAAKRMASLQTKHSRDWLRSIDRCNFFKGKEVFEEGFLAQVNFRLTSFVPKPTDPVLATIKRLAAWGGDGPQVDALMASPLLAQVREFDGSARMVAALCPVALEKLKKLRFELDSREDLERVRELKAPALEHLTLDKRLIDTAGAAFKPEELFALPLLATVKHLHVRPSVSPGAWLAVARERLKLDTLTIGAPTTFDYRFDLKTGEAAVLPHTFFARPNEDDLGRLLIVPLGTLPDDVLAKLTIELPAGYSLPEKIAELVRTRGVRVVSENPPAA